MKIIDRYLIRQFLQTVFFALLAFILIFLVIDAMENLDDFIDQNVPWLNILQYYVVFTPEIIKLITPVAVLFGALFTAGKVSTLSELTAMRASGVSLYRFDDTRRILGSFAPNVLFPYIRQTLSDMVSKGGFPPFFLPPVNFDALYERSLQERAAQQAAKDPAAPQQVN